MKQIYEILKEWKKESGAKGVIQFKYSCLTGNLTIYTSYPGWLIGKAGLLVEKYRNILKEKIIGFKSLEIVETDYYYA